MTDGQGLGRAIGAFLPLCRLPCSLSSFIPSMPWAACSEPRCYCVETHQLANGRQNQCPFDQQRAHHGVR